MAKLPGIVGAVVMGLGMSQFPEFTQQYQQRLGGAVDELRIITREFDRAATANSLTRAAALAQYHTSDSDFLEQRGEDMQTVFTRFARLSEDLRVLENANAIERLQNFTHMSDTRIAKRAWETYKPALPLTAEGLTFAAGGGLIGFTGFSGLFGLIFFRRKRKPV